MKRDNQTIKCMIGSMLMTLNAPSKWKFAREDATCTYNTMRHSPTSTTPFILMFALPINDIIQPDVVASVNEQDNEDVEDEALIDIREEAPVDSLNFNNLPTLLPEDFEADDDIVDIDLSIVKNITPLETKQESQPKKLLIAWWLEVCGGIDI
ncbi:hypothetical protein NGRA_2078 [Nosema granulosis]|uniref:Uncharacterized protein n=1 Tax=Nosema granulosis TaxID=83296 RepID=A0A9P6GXD1_9MICR|nr:hypothetical protein NGRA_2078 [Nosema granulosis]